MIRVFHSGSWIPDPDPDFLPIPDPGVKKAPDPGSRMRMGWDTECCFWGENGMSVSTVYV